MAASSGRPVAMAVLGTVFIGVLAGVALGAQASWNASCDSGELCNYRYIDFKVPLAATSGSDSDYTNDKYPNTQVVMNDEVRIDQEPVRSEGRRLVRAHQIQRQPQRLVGLSIGRVGLE